MAEYFRRRAVAAAVVAGVIAAAGSFVLRADAEYLFDGLTSRALPVLILSGVCGAGALLLLIRGAARGARALALAAVAGAVISWGVAQSPYILPESLTFSAAAAPAGTLTAVLAAVALAAVIVLPGFVLLYVVDQRGLLPEEGVDDIADRAPDRRARRQPAPAIGHDRRQH
jgi:cytochrome bd ubiquinol oxidase subunit II